MKLGARLAAAWQGVAQQPWRLALAILALAVLLRAPALGRSLWLDEAVSMHHAALPGAELLHELRVRDTHPPGWYMALGGWLDLADGDLGARLLPLLLNLAHVLVLGLVAARLFGRAAGFVAAALAAVSPEVVWPGYELRSFAQAALLSTLGWLCALVAAERGGWWRWALAGVACAASLWTFYYAALAGPAVALGVLAWRGGRRALLGLLLAGAGAVAAFLPCLPLLRAQLGWVEANTAEGNTALALDADGLLGTWLHPHVVRAAPWHALALLALAGATLFLLLRRRPLPAATPASEEQRRALRSVALTCVAFLLLVLAAGLAGSFVSRRYAGFLAGAWCVLAAGLWTRLSDVARGTLLAAVLAAGVATSATKAFRAERIDWRGLVARLEQRAEPEALVLVTPPWERYSLRHYAREERRIVRLPTDLVLPPPDRDGRTALAPLHLERLERVLAEEDALWLVIGTARDARATGAPEVVLSEHLRAHGWSLVGTDAVRGARLERWRRDAAR